MPEMLKKIIIRTALRGRLQYNKEVSNYQLAIGWRELKITFFSLVKDVLFITAGIFSAAFGVKAFLLTNQFIDGGATGISLLISLLTKIPLYLLIPVVNIPFIILALKVVNRTFAIKTALAICGLALVLATFEFPTITNDNLLIALFGGFFLGAGIGLSVRGGAVIDGTEVLAIYLSRKLGTTMGDVIVLINICIFGAAAYFLSIEIAMYSLITYLAASKTLDFIVEGLEEYIGVTIISSHNEEMRQMLINSIGRGFTVYNGKRGFGRTGESKNVDIIYTVVTRLELNKLTTEIEKIDPHSFVVMSSVRDTKGGMIKKRPLKH